MTSGISVHKGRVLHALCDPAHSDAMRFYEDGVLAVDRQGRVAYAGPASGFATGSDSEVIDHGDCFILPGFVDTHIHYPQGRVIGAYGAQLLDWLNRYTFPAEARFHDPAHARREARLFLAELLRNGTTTALVFGSVHAESVDSFFEVCNSFQLRMLCGKVMMDRNAPAELLDTPASSYEDSARLIEKWHGLGRLMYAVTPRFAPTSSPQQLDMAGRLLREYPDVRLQTHLSENQREIEWVKELFPKRRDYVDVYQHHGLLGKHSVFAHGIHLSEREWQSLAESESSIAFCPCSNLFIGSGLFNLKQADEYGVKTGMATDVGGGDSFSMFRVLNEAYKVLQLNGQNLHPFRAFYLATLGGARTLGLEHEIGNFEPGKEADFIVVNPAATPLMAARMEVCESLEETLFATLMMADDRSIRHTYILGRRIEPDAIYPASG